MTASGIRQDMIRRQPKLSISQLLARAAAIEQAAAKRYAKLSEAMRLIGRHELADLFRSLELEEEEHREAIRRLGGPTETLSKPGEDQPADESSDVVSGEELDFDPHTLSAYGAFAIAVQNEDRAFAYFAEVAADTDDPQVRELAERLAQEELSHAAKLRQARRAAYHAAGRAPASHRWKLAQRNITSFAGFIAVAGSLEAGLSARHEALAKRLSDARASKAETVQQVARLGHETAARLVPVPGAERQVRDEHLPDDVPGALQDMLLDLEEALNFYVNVADAAPDERTLSEAQRLAYSAIQRLTLLREALAALEDRR